MPAELLLILKSITQRVSRQIISRQTRTSIIIGVFFLTALYRSTYCCVLLNLIKMISYYTYVLNLSTCKGTTKPENHNSQFKTKITQSAINRTSTDVEHRWNTQNFDTYLYSYKETLPKTAIFITTKH